VGVVVPRVAAMAVPAGGDAAGRMVGIGVNAVTVGVSPEMPEVLEVPEVAAGCAAATMPVGIACKGEETTAAAGAIVGLTVRSVTGIGVGASASSSTAGSWLNEITIPAGAAVATGARWKPGTWLRTRALDSATVPVTSIITVIDVANSIQRGMEGRGG